MNPDASAESSLISLRRPVDKDYPSSSKSPLQIVLPPDECSPIPHYFGSAGTLKKRWKMG